MSLAVQGPPGGSFQVSDDEQVLPCEVTRQQAHPATAGLPATSSQRYSLRYDGAEGLDSLTLMSSIELDDFTYDFENEID